MPMPHRTQQQLIKRRLVGKDGAERIRELRAILAELPGYRNGPYADLRKWVEGELDGDAHAEEGRASRLDRRAPRGRGADRARRAAERGQVLAPAGSLGHPDPHRRLRVHHDAARGRDDAARRRARPARGDSRPDRRGGRRPRRRPRAARRAAERRRDPLLPRLRPSARRARDDPGRGRRRGDRATRDPGRDEVRRGAAAGASRAARSYRSPCSTTRASTGCGRSSGP